MRFNDAQMRFLKRLLIARVATCGSNCMPHVSPVYFSNTRSSIFFAIEKNTQKYSDLVSNPHAALVLDEFQAHWLRGSGAPDSVEKAVVIQGPAKIFGNVDRSYSFMYRKLFEKYPDYRREGWKKGESPIVNVEARKITSWGLVR